MFLFFFCFFFRPFLLFLTRILPCPHPSLLPHPPLLIFFSLLLLFIHRFPQGFLLLIPPIPFFHFLPSFLALFAVAVATAAQANAPTM